eukprot:403368461
MAWVQRRNNQQFISNKVLTSKQRLSHEVYFKPQINQHSLKYDDMRRNVLQAMSTNENVNKGIEFNHKIQDDIKFQEFKEGDYHYIDTPNKLQEILRSLYKYSVLGVDLENHQTKSYHGFLCLIQITTPDYQTYLIDCLKLREEIKTYLGAIFESHTTLKIFHGCVNSDITWLQRDFGFATVNVFDTQESYKKLFKGQRVSLLHLWTTYCKDRVKISKEQKNMFQKADWSMRPLSSEMLNYAAHDSHYLIYIAKRLQKNFENQNQLQELADICNQVNIQCVSQLFKPRDITFNKDEEYKTPFRKILDGFDPESEEFLLTEYIFKRIYNLREHLAQIIDVTPSEICDDSMLYVLSKKRPIEYQQTRNMLDEQGKKTTTYFRSIIENLNIEIEQAIDDFPKEIDSMKEYYSKLPNHGWNSQQERMRQKEERKKKIIKHYSCKKVVYENCKMVAPDGELLSNCDFKKAQWYIEKGLGEKISDNPFTIKLMFEPNGRGKAKPFEELYDDNFYVADRENKYKISQIHQKVIALMMLYFCVSHAMRQQVENKIS